MTGHRPAIQFAHALNPSAISRFEAKVHREPSGCWRWLATTSSGYGIFSLKIDGRWRAIKAHRVSYTVARGEIPAGLELDHLCRNRWCVNPEHLEAVTTQINTIRGNGATGRNARKTHCPSGHEYTDDNIFWRKTKYGTTGRECRQCVLAANRRKCLVEDGVPCHFCGGRYQHRRALRVHLGKFHGVSVRASILAMAGDGYSDEQIAESLDITTKHVRTELRVLRSLAA